MACYRSTKSVTRPAFGALQARGAALRWSACGQPAEVARCAASGVCPGLGAGVLPLQQPVLFLERLAMRDALGEVVGLDLAPAQAEDRRAPVRLTRLHRLPRPVHALERLVEYPNGVL